jgi:two-component system OmpR family sensor kinase
MFKSDKELDDMIKKTLHELNTPIATIQMNSNLLSKTTHDEKSLQRLERINQSCHNLLELYDHMEYNINSKIDNVQTSTFDLKDEVTRSCKKFDDIKGKIIIENYVSSTNITTDKFGFAIVLDNLIANAIKYNKEDGFIKISNENNILKIQDSGVGIDTKNIMKVFDKYYQEDYEHVGIGLGLNIVKEFCDTHKIDIKIDSKENVGTTFSLNYSKLTDN